MKDVNRKKFHLVASRWRLFSNTCWMSLTSGIAFYLLTLWLGIPYGWAVFILVFRALVWALATDIRNLDIYLDSDKISGPDWFLTAAPSTLRVALIESDNVFQMLGVFSFEDSSGERIFGCYGWYSPEDRRTLRQLLEFVCK